MAKNDDLHGTRVRMAILDELVPDEQVMKQAAENSAPVSIPKAEDWIARLSAVAAEITNFKMSVTDDSTDEMVNLDFAQQQLLETIESMREVLPE